MSTWSPAAFFDTHPVFTRSEFAAAHPAAANSEQGRSGRAVEKALAYHESTGRLVRVKRGLYAVVGRGRSPAGFRADAFLVASRFAPDAVLAYHTALQLHGLAQSALRRFTVCTRNDVREVAFQGVVYAGVRPPRASGDREGTEVHVTTVNRQGLDVRVTDLERTVVDVLDRLEVSGGWEEVMRSLEHVRVLDAPAAAAYALRLGRAATAAKLGLLLDAHRDELLVEDEVLADLADALPRAVHRVERRHAGPFRTVPRWRLAVPAPLFDPTWEELR